MVESEFFLIRRLGLPEEPAPICFRITGKKKPGQSTPPKRDSKPQPMASQPDQDHEVIIIEDADDDTLSSKRSRSPWEAESGPRVNSRSGRERSRERYLRIDSQIKFYHKINTYL